MGTGTTGLRQRLGELGSTARLRRIVSPRLLLLCCVATVVGGPATAPPPPPPSCDDAPYDVDGNSQVASLSDGLVLLRYFFGFRGSVLINGALGQGCTRCTASEIEAFIELALAGCPECGDDVINAAEDCDGADLGGESCLTQNFSSGNLDCTAACTFDVSACGDCGNGFIDGSEECDMSDHGGETCQSQSFFAGNLSCTSSCTFSVSACTNCGNGVVDFNDGEVCDGGNLGGASCESLGFLSGNLVCDGSCVYDATDCSSN